MKNILCSLSIMLLVVLLASRLCSEDIYSDNIVIILDGSGSMGDPMKSSPKFTKMDVAKKALKKVSQQIPDGTKIGLLVFDNHSSEGKSQWNYPLGALNRANLAEAIDKVVSGGGTPLGEHIKIGADRLLEERKKQYGYGTYRLLIVTDGEATDAKVMENYVPEVIARGITMDVIGVDMAALHTLSKRAHSYRKADDPASLAKALSEVVAEVSGNASSKAMVDGNEAFETLKPIPSEMVMKMIDSLAKSGNDPIGSVKASNESHDGTGSQKQSPAGSTQTNKQGKGCGSGFFYFVIFVFILMIFRRLRKTSNHHTG